MNIVLGQLRSVDSTDYISPGPTGQEFITTVVRHHCRTPQLSCNLIRTSSIHVEKGDRLYPGRCLGLEIEQIAATAAFQRLQTVL